MGRVKTKVSGNVDPHVVSLQCLVLISEQDEEMIRETLRELEQVSLQAVAAAELNEKLVETLQRHKKNVRFNSLITYRC